MRWFVLSQFKEQGWGVGGERLTRTVATVRTRTNEKAHPNHIEREVTSEVKCQCGKICKNTRGLKIHQAKAKCGAETTLLQRSVATPCQAHVSTKPDAPHSTGDLLATTLHQNHTTVNTDTSQQHQPANKRVKWPMMNSNKEWQQLDKDAKKILEVALAGKAERKKQ